MIPDLIRALECGVSHLERLGIPYVIGGSLASSAHGEPRPSGDVDVVIDLAPTRVVDFTGAFQGEFYVAETAVREAVARESAFNVVHLETVVKLDFFVMGTVGLRRLQLARRRAGPVDSGIEKSFQISTPEDIILQKLEWFRKGSETSDRQWRDILGVLKLQGRRLDFAYLRATAEDSQLTELLLRALEETGLGSRDGA